MGKSFFKKLGIKKIVKIVNRAAKNNPALKAFGRTLSRTANATAQGVADRFGMGEVYKQTRKAIVGGIKTDARIQRRKRRR